MRLRNVRISKLLSIGIWITVVFIIMLGIYFFLTVSSVDQNIKDIYNHPLTVRRAVGDLNYDILSINIETKEMILENNKQDIELIVNIISNLESNAKIQIDTIRSQYLGPKSNVQDLESSINLWTTIRNETIRLIRNGNIDDAIKRLKEKGIEEDQVNIIMKRVQVVSDFAKIKGDQFYFDSQKQYNAVLLQLLIGIIIIILLSSVINYELTRLAVKPLRELTLTAEALGRKDYKARSSYKSKNELGVLSRSLNSMAAVIEKEIENKDNVAKLSSAFISNDALRPFCHELLKALLNYTDSQVGAIYLVNNQKTHYEHFESVGLSNSSHKSFNISKHEGEFGAVISSSKIHHLKDIPSGVNYTFVTVSGDFKPKEIITIPIVNGENVIAVISLASIDKYSESSITLINNIWSELTARFLSAQNYEKTLEFSKELLSLNSELEAQAGELSTQTEELMDQNIELGTQKKQLNDANQHKSTF